MNTSQDVTDGRLADADAPRKLCLSRIRRFQIGVECLHMRPQSIGNAYRCAIGHSYNEHMHALSMAKRRSFLERATEALREKYPREKATQAKLAAIAGVKQPSVNDWKEGYPTMDTGVRLAQSLGVCVEWLFTERGPKHPAAMPDKEDLSSIWPHLDERKKAEVARFAGFIKDNEEK